MRIFAIDDEPIMLKLLHDAIVQAEPGAEIMDFEDGVELMCAITERGVTPDVVFADIELRGMTGLELAVQIKSAVPDAKIIFVTAFPKYAADAYRLHINGYIVKPAEAERIREELDALAVPKKAEEPADQLRIQCFGYFEVFWHGKPLMFARSQTKELLAYLVDRNGEACTNEEIMMALWEDESDERAAKNRIRVLLNDLRTTLRGVGMEGILIRERRQLAIRTDMVDCDYYRMKHGDLDAVNAFRGEYMKQYSWAEQTLAKTYFSYMEGT